MSRTITDKQCLNCESELEYVIAYDVGFYKCPFCGSQWDIEEYWHDCQEIENGCYEEEE